MRVGHETLVADASAARTRIREAALRFGIVDRPDGRLKQHEQPVAYDDELLADRGHGIAPGYAEGRPDRTAPRIYHRQCPRGYFTPWVIRAMGREPTVDEVERLVGEYRGRFALDFAYEEIRRKITDRRQSVLVARTTIDLVKSSRESS